MKLPRGLGRLRGEGRRTPEEPEEAEARTGPARRPEGETRGFERIHEETAAAEVEPGEAGPVVDAWRGALERIRAEDGGTALPDARLEGTAADATHVGPLPGAAAGEAGRARSDTTRDSPGSGSSGGLSGATGSSAAGSGDVGGGGSGGSAGLGASDGSPDVGPSEASAGSGSAGASGEPGPPDDDDADADGSDGRWGAVRDVPVGWLVSNRFALVGLVVVALVALYGVAHFSTPRDVDARADVLGTRRVAVVSSLVACPGAEMGGGAGTRFGVVSPGGTPGPGRADVRRGGSTGKRVAGLSRGGGAWFGDVTRPSGPLVVSGSGALAAGLTSGQISVGKGGNGALSGTHCTRPATDSWFVGPGPEDGDLRLRVANPDDGPATVSVDVYSDVGELDDTGTGAIFVPPHGSEVVSLADRARGARLAALHVRTSMGRVAASVEAKGTGKAGSDFVPGGSAAAKDLVVPGVPGGSGARDLLVAAPGDHDANVRIRAVTPDGTIVPGGEGILQVPAGAVMPMPLDGMLSGRPCALTLTSDIPVVAGVRARSSYSGGSDVAYTAAEPALDGRGVAAENRGDKGYQASVVLTALGGGVTARVSTETTRGAGAPKTVTIKAGHTTEVVPRVPRGGASGFGIVVTRTSGTGKLYAARVLWRKVSGGKLLTLDPLESAAGTVPVYPANGSLDAVVR